MEKLNDIVVFFSDKDKSSKKLISIIKQISNYNKYFTFINIHTEKELTKDHGIKLIPSVLYDKEIFTGADTIGIIFWVLDINQEDSSEQKPKKQSRLSDICEEDQFCNISEVDIPKFKSITENTIMTDKKNLDSDIERFNSSREEIDNFFHKRV